MEPARKRPQKLVEEQRNKRDTSAKSRQVAIEAQVPADEFPVFFFHDGSPSAKLT